MQQEIHVDLMLRESGSMKATAEVTFSTPQGPLTLSGFKVIEKDAGKPWVSLPSKEYSAGGQRRFQKMVELSKPGMRAVSEAVLNAYEERLKGK